MSILIKGMDAPKYGGYIEIRLYDDRAEGEFQEHVYTDLEIEEVPTPHGRLIDADKEYKELSEMKVEGEMFTTAVEFSKLIVQNAPTVIEAEGNND